MVSPGTLLTLQRIDWVIGQLEQHYQLYRRQGGLFYDNVGKSQQALLGDYGRRQQAQQYLLNATAAKGLTALASLFLLCPVHQAVGGATSALRLGWLADHIRRSPRRTPAAGDWPPVG